MVRDVTVKRLGTAKHHPLLERPLRIVEVHGREPGQVWVLATNAHDLSAELVKTACHRRWQIELFFRWLKCVPGGKHLVSECRQGVTRQVDFAIIAALLTGLWVGVKPNRRTCEMLGFSLSGWATLDELERHLEKLRAKNKEPPRTS